MTTSNFKNQLENHSTDISNPDKVHEQFPGPAPGINEFLEQKSSLL